MDKHTRASEKERMIEKEEKKKREKEDAITTGTRTKTILCMQLCSGKKGKRRTEEPASKRETERISARKK